FSHSATSAERPAQLTAWERHVTGWNSQEFDREIVPRVFEVLLNRDFRGRLRIDRAADGKGFVGRLKVYAHRTGGAGNEELENDIAVRKWDGTNLEFVRPLPNIPQTYTGTVKGRTIRGTFTQQGTPGVYDWHGVRAEVLAYGLTPKPEAQRKVWQ